MYTLPRLALAGWFVLTLAVAAGATALHEAPLPMPEPPLQQTGAFHVTHALSMQCGCSRRIVDYLLSRGASAVPEDVLLLDAEESLASQLRARGFAVHVLDEAALAASYGIQAVPSLVIYRPDGSVAYRGAHAPRPQMDPTDLEMLSAIRAGQGTASNPIFGCAVSRELQRRHDPLRLKYSLWR